MKQDKFKTKVKTLACDGHFDSCLWIWCKVLTNSLFLEAVCLIATKHLGGGVV